MGDAATEQGLQCGTSPFDVEQYQREYAAEYRVVDTQFSDFERS
jgi:hypothetical protein